MGWHNAKRNRVVIAHVDLAVSMTAESNALAIATVANWLDVSSWRSPLAGEPRTTRKGGADPQDQQSFSGPTEFEIDMFCDASETITSPALYVARVHPVTIADDDVDTVDFTNDELDLTSHAYQTGDGPVRLTTTDTLPAGLATATDYYVRDIGTNSIQLHTSRAGAVADTGQVTFTDGGTGTHTIVDVQSSPNADEDTRRIHHSFYGDLNAGATITLAAQTAYTERILHSPLNLYYIILGTSGTGAQTVTTVLTPIQEVEQ